MGVTVAVGAFGVGEGVKVGVGVRVEVGVEVKVGVKEGVADGVAVEVRVGAALRIRSPRRFGILQVDKITQIRRNDHIPFRLRCRSFAPCQLIRRIIKAKLSRQRILKSAPA